MESCLSYIYPHTRISSIVGILKTTAHNAFPVVSVDKNTHQLVVESDYEGNPVSSNEQFARTTTFSQLTSEQKLRSQLQSRGVLQSGKPHRRNTEMEHHLASQRINISSRKLKRCVDGQDFESSSSAPLLSNLMNEDPEVVKDILNREVAQGKTLACCYSLGKDTSLHG